MTYDDIQADLDKISLLIDSVADYVMYGTPIAMTVVIDARGAFKRLTRAFLEMIRDENKTDESDMQA